MCRSRGHRRRRGLQGFTLLEVMVSTLIFGTVSIAVMAAFLFLGTSMARMVYAQQLEENSRRALYLFNQDLTKATKVTPDNTSPNDKLVLTLPSTLTSATPAHTVTHTVTYQYYSTTQKVTRTTVDIDTTASPNVTTTVASDVLKNLTAFDFNYFSVSGTSLTASQWTAATSTPASYTPIKAVQFSFTASLGTTTATGTSIYRTQTSYQTLSPIVYLRNTSNRDLLP